MSKTFQKILYDLDKNKLVVRRQLKGEEMKEALATQPEVEEYRYFKTFSKPRSYIPKVEDLLTLAQYMVLEGREEVNSNIPSGYTYLGQFIDHDISSDSKAGLPEQRIPISSIVNNRTPFFDLESLYGNGPDDEKSKALYEVDSAFLKIGWTVPDTSGGVTQSFPNDLPRKAGSAEAELVEPRNDENLAIAQTHVAFIKFYNAVVRTLDKNGPREVFEEARKIVTLHYQSIVFHDFLPRIVDPALIEDIQGHRNRFYRPDPGKPQIPVEFSIAGYRLGHSMVRNSYNWNHFFQKGGSKGAADLALLLEFTNLGGGLKKKQHLISIWCIDWTRFYDFGNSPEGHVNFASGINTNISPQLGHLSFLTQSPDKQDPRASLPYFSLLRSWAVGLTTGQVIASNFSGILSAPGCDPDQIAALLPEDLKITFSGTTPLWFYILAEAGIQKNGNSLGEVGGRLVAEVFITLLKLSPISIFEQGKPVWEPTLEAKDPKKFTMTDLLNFVAKQNKGSGFEFDELNPLKDYEKTGPKNPTG